MFSNIRLFKDPIEPTWEDPVNKSGGKFVFILEGQFDKKKLVCVPHEYQMVLLYMILGLFNDNEQICGCVLSIRVFGIMVSLWNCKSDDDAYIEAMKEKLSVLLNIETKDITYQQHDKTVNNNSKNVKKTELKKQRSKKDLKSFSTDPKDSEDVKTVRFVNTEDDIDVKKEKSTGFSLELRRRSMSSSNLASLKDYDYLEMSYSNEAPIVSPREMPETESKESGNKTNESHYKTNESHYKTNESHYKTSESHVNGVQMAFHETYQEVLCSDVIRNVDKDIEEKPTPQLQPTSSAMHFKSILTWVVVFMAIVLGYLILQ